MDSLQTAASVYNTLLRKYYSFHLSDGYNLNENYSKALTLGEIKELKETDPVKKVLELFKDNSHDKEKEIER